MCGLVGTEVSWGLAGGEKAGAGGRRTGQLVFVLEELVAELVGADQHTGLGVACVLRSVVVSSQQQLGAEESGVPMYCRREAGRLAAGGRSEGARGAHVELVPEVLRSRLSVSVWVPWVAEETHLQANLADIAQGPCDGRHGCWWRVN